MKNFYYEEYGKKAEQFVEEALLKQGITKTQIHKFKSKGICLGCSYLHEKCQCAFGGSAHPNMQERIAWVKKLIVEEEV